MKKVLWISAIMAIFLPAVLPAQIARTVLIERFTGTWCQYCPFGGDTINAILRDMNNVVTLAYHGGSSNEPMRTTDGNTMMANLPVTSWPTAAIDRMIWNTGTQQNPIYAIPLSRSVWRVATNIHLTNSPTSPLSYNLSGTFDTTSRLLTVVARVNILQQMTGSFLLNLVISEDSLNYAQVKWTSSGNIIVNPYWHFKVVRAMVTGPFGTSLTTTGLAANTTETRILTYTIPSVWNLEKLHLTAFVVKHVSSGSAGNYREVQGTSQRAFKDMVADGDITLTPVDLVSFAGKQVGQNVVLEWRTASENSNMGWFVERRSIDEEWKALGFVNGSGTTVEQQVYAFTDERPAPNTLYSYRLRQVDYDGRSEYSPKFLIMVAAVPTATRLLPNYPNPFNPSTEIGVELASAADVTLEVYDLLGRKVKTLVKENMTAGVHHFSWDGTNDRGEIVAAGAYLYRLSTPELTASRQMHLMK